MLSKMDIFSTPLSAQTIRDASGNIVQVFHYISKEYSWNSLWPLSIRTRQAEDSSRFQSFGIVRDDCTCWCKSIFSSPAEDSRYSIWRYTGDNCETLPNFCPGGTKSSEIMVPPNYTCAPCQGNWEGRLCDEYKAQCFHGSTVGNPYCQWAAIAVSGLTVTGVTVEIPVIDISRIFIFKKGRLVVPEASRVSDYRECSRCECEAGWLHQLDAGGKGQCDVCESRDWRGPQRMIWISRTLP